MNAIFHFDNVYMYGRNRTALDESVLMEEYYVSGKVTGVKEKQLSIELNDRIAFAVLSGVSEVDLYCENAEEFEEGDIVEAVCYPEADASDPLGASAY